MQRSVAATLATRIAALDLPASPRVLEFGCGTGFLTRALREAGVSGTWLVTDLAPAMIERARIALGPLPDVEYAALDAERGPFPAGPFDLICSSLALQWFDDAPAALFRLSKLLAPGGHLIVTTLAPGSFAEWHAAHRAEGLEAGTPAFAPMEEFARLCDEGLDVALDVAPVIDRPGTARGFLRGVKAIGAGTPAGGHRPLTPPQLRRVMGQFDRNGGNVTYEVLTCHLRVPHPQP